MALFWRRATPGAALFGGVLYTLRAALFWRRAALGVSLFWRRVTLGISLSWRRAMYSRGVAFLLARLFPTNGATPDRNYGTRYRWNVLFCLLPLTS